MSFNSFLFLVFAALFFAFWPFANRRNNLRWAYLVLASFLFYGWGNWFHWLILMTVCVVGFTAGVGMNRYPKQRRLILVLALLANIGLLVFFRYREFIWENISVIMSLFGISLKVKPEIPSILNILPLGISFYTFQAISYLFDVYNGRLQPASNPLHFFAYLSLFPKLIAGPIERGKNLLSQLTQALPVTEAQRWQGLKWIVYGYFLKTVIADNLAPIVDKAFGTLPLSTSSLFWWGIITAFAFQIYCDFNGYSLIALGLGKWMGYDLSFNFNYPYTSTSLGEFWNRWHITLSTWLRDYIFFPISRSALGKGKQHLAMWITMLISGLWHGAAWTFIAWGGLHAMYISLERITHWPQFLKRYRLGKWVALVLVLFQVWIAWVFFRATNITQALTVLKTMFSFSGNSVLTLGFNTTFFMSLVVLRELYHFSGLAEKKFLVYSWLIRFEPIWVALVIITCVYLRGSGSGFIYFQF